MFEWRVTVSCPVQPLSGSEHFHRRTAYQRRLYVWTPQMCASDAYNEGLRILTGWPPGTRLVSILPVGVYRWLEETQSHHDPHTSSRAEPLAGSPQ